MLEDAITEVENFMSSEGIQSWHILFPSDDDLLKLENHGFIKDLAIGIFGRIMTINHSQII